jgi:hypothetical protein
MASFLLVLLRISVLARGTTRMTHPGFDLSLIHVNEGVRLSGIRFARGLPHTAIYEEIARIAESNGDDAASLISKLQRYGMVRGEYRDEKSRSMTARRSMARACPPNVASLQAQGLIGHGPV